ncbi:MAG: hypothetical protein AAB421_04775 [Patescibacteria group bacterium]
MGLNPSSRNATAFKLLAMSCAQTMASSSFSERNQHRLMLAEAALEFGLSHADSFAFVTELCEAAGFPAFEGALANKSPAPKVRVLSDTTRPSHSLRVAA